MFTGIVREVGRVVSFDGRRLVVEAEATRAAEGDSVAVDGVCLTAVDGSQLAFDVVDETLSRTTLGSLEPGSRVNLEPALRAGEPLGGHLVQGHVDGLGRVRSTGEPVWIDAPAELGRYLVEKGSITVDGVSLTVAAVDERGFAVALVPHTLEATTLDELAPGDAVNLEVDILAKYVERLLPASLRAEGPKK
jgi:riboflavin synthase